MFEIVSTHPCIWYIAPSCLVTCFLQNYSRFELHLTSDYLFFRLSYKFSAFGKANNKHNPLIWLCNIYKYVMNASSQTLNTHNAISIYFDHTVCTQCCSHQIDITYMCKQAKLNSCRSDSIESFSGIKGKKVLDLLLHVSLLVCEEPMFVVSEDLRPRLKKKHLLLAQCVYPSRACITLGPVWSNAKQSLVDSPEHKALGFPSAGDQ